MYENDVLGEKLLVARKERKGMKIRKLRIGIVLLGALSMLTLGGCNENGNADVNQQNTNSNILNGEGADLQENGDGTEQAEESQDMTQEIMEIAEVSPEKKQVEIYFGNENGDAILSEVVEMESVTANKVMEELVRKEVVTQESKILGVVKQTKDGKIRLKLNMSKEFGELVSNMGSSGEYIIVGSVVNTFLRLYDAEDVLILIEGETFETGHQLYNNYLQFYENEN